MSRFATDVSTSVLRLVHRCFHSGVSVVMADLLCKVLIIYGSEFGAADKPRNKLL